MRTGNISINGKNYTLCFSLRVVRQCTEKFGSVEGLFSALDNGSDLEALDNALWTVSAMMQAGERYAKENGQKPEKALTVEQMYDLCDISDFASLKASIVVTVVNGQKTNVEAEPPKNAETTLGE